MILVGEPVAGVTLIRMDEGLDTGPIVAQETWILDGTETSVVLEAEAARRGAGLLRRSLGPWLAGALPATPQPEVGATRTRLLRREDGRLDPALTAAQLERQVRAYLPWPGSFVETAFGRLIVHEARAVAGASGDAPGTLVADGDGLALTTGAGRLHLIRAQLAGHRATGAAELRRGSPALVGQTVLLR
jgi:methionyl-tRNA formyltransferase